jgi:hypothetical protein
MGTGNNLDPHVFYIDDSSRVQHLAWVGGVWQWEDVFDALPPAQKAHVHAASVSAIAAMGSGNNRDPHVFYLDNAGRIQHLGWVGGHWEWEDVLSNLRRGQPQINAERGSIFGVIGTGDNLDPHVLYVDAHANVQHLVWLGDHWNIEIPDVTHAATNGPAPPAMAVLRVMGTGRNFDPHVFYLDQQNRHVQRIGRVTDHWVVEDVSKRSSAPQAHIGGALLAVMGTGENRDPRVFYVDNGLDVQQLAWIGDSDSPWWRLDPSGDLFWAPPVSLMSAARAPKPDAGALVAMGSGG